MTHPGTLLCDDLLLLLITSSCCLLPMSLPPVLPCADRPTLLLFFVMICCPLAMNAVQLLIQDTVLKWRRGSGAPVSGGGTVAGGELMQRQSRPEKVALLNSQERSTAV